MLTTLLARATFAVSAWLARAEESSAAASLARRRSERREAAEELRDANARLVARAAVVQHLETNARYFSLLEPGELEPGMVAASFRSVLTGSRASVAPDASSVVARMDPA